MPLWQRLELLCTLLLHTVETTHCHGKNWMWGLWKKTPRTVFDSRLGVRILDAVQRDVLFPTAMTVGFPSLGLRWFLRAQKAEQKKLKTPMFDHCLPQDEWNRVGSFIATLGCKSWGRCCWWRRSGTALSIKTKGPDHPTCQLLPISHQKEVKREWERRERDIRWWQIYIYERLACERVVCMSVCVYVCVCMTVCMCVCARCVATHKTCPTP